MAISIWMVMAVTVLAATLLANRMGVLAKNRRDKRSGKTPGDQIRPLPRQLPLIGSQAYS